MGKVMKALTSASLLFLGASADAACQEVAERCQVGSEESAARDSVLLQLGVSSTSVTEVTDSSAEEASAVAGGEWCEIEAPSHKWTLKYCSDAGNEVKVLTYNLYWWNLFGWQFRNGNGGSAGKLIASAGRENPHDFMGFQECDDVNRVLSDAGLIGQYASIVAGHAIAIAYRKAAWDLIDHGMDEVAEDRPEQWWGTRGAQWARFRSKANGYKVLFVNHHGALPVGTGGKCGHRNTANRILRTITAHRKRGDGVVLVGDFNSDAGTEEIKVLQHRLRRVFTGTSFGGVDHIFSSCGGSRVVETRNLGNGGSDHDALDAVIRL